jgi:hypothetical protein
MGSVQKESSEIRNLPVNLTLEKQIEEQRDEFEIVIYVENLSDRPLNRLNLIWQYDYDDVLDEPARKMNAITEFCQLGDGPLRPGESRQFVYPQEHLLALLSVVDSISPERYSIAVQFDGTTEKAMDGSMFGGWVQGEFG